MELSQSELAASNDSYGNKIEVLKYLQSNSFAGQNINVKMTNRNLHITKTYKILCVSVTSKMCISIFNFMHLDEENRTLKPKLNNKLFSQQLICRRLL